MTAPAHTAYAAGSWWGWGATLAVTSLLVVVVTLPPFVDHPVRLALMQVFSQVCHQLPARSPHIDGVQLAVCHRCYGIYWGLPLAVAAFLVLRRWDGFLNRHARYLMTAAIAIPGIDWGLGWIGLWQNTPLSRLMTGWVFGFIVGYFLARAFVEAFQRKQPGPVAPTDSEATLPVIDPT